MTSVTKVRAAHGRRDLLAAYTNELGESIRRQQSAVALRAARVDAELAYRARGTFLASMNHELRTPLNAIMGFATMLRDGESFNITPDQQNQYLDHIIHSGELLLSHIGTILEIAEAESGGKKLARRAFVLRDVIEQVMEGVLADHADAIPSYGADIPDDLPSVDADPDKIAAAITRVVQFITRDFVNPVEVKLTVRRGLSGASADFVYVALDVRGGDHSTEDIGKAMRTFDVVHEGLDRKFEGHLLGLPIAKNLIELNQGKFNVKVLEEGGLLVRFALLAARDGHEETLERLAS